MIASQVSQCDVLWRAVLRIYELLILNGDDLARYYVLE